MADRDQSVTSIEEHLTSWLEKVYANQQTAASGKFMLDVVGCSKMILPWYVQVGQKKEDGKWGGADGPTSTSSCSTFFCSIFVF